jgi:tripartite-type tricarboxylate transporter receptor subunit TctC
MKRMPCARLIWIIGHAVLGYPTQGIQHARGTMAMRWSLEKRRRTMSAAAVMVTVLASGTTPAAAQAWPTKNITFVVSQSAGASPDVMARLIAERLAAHLKQGVIVENKTGGGNVIGAMAAARATPDGYTFFFATSAALVGNPFLMKALPYDPVKDFAPVALVTRSNQLLVVHPEVAAKSLAELIALEKTSPGKLSLAVDGPRNLAGLTAQALNKRAGTQFVLVPYPNINAGVQDVVAGRVEAGIFSVSVVEALTRDGKLKALAGAAATPVSTLPEVRPMADAIPGFDFSGWFMLMAPAGTPREIVTQMNEALATVMKDERIAAMAPKLGFELDGKGLGKPEAAAQFLAEQLALWQRTTKELGIEPQ